MHVRAAARPRVLTLVNSLPNQARTRVQAIGWAGQVIEEGLGRWAGPARPPPPPAPQLLSCWQGHRAGGAQGRPGEAVESPLAVCGPCASRRTPIGAPTAPSQAETAPGPWRDVRRSSGGCWIHIAPSASAQRPERAAEALRLSSRPHSASWRAGGTSAAFGTARSLARRSRGRLSATAAARDPRRRLRRAAARGRACSSHGGRLGQALRL